ncbi:hypothetical protein HYU11_02190 [Candidatus Woesearchaeota archaeon]|nr:hypothetical protein [Candidatus Woesearchaeota archaeon]
MATSPINEKNLEAIVKGITAGRDDIPGYVPMNYLTGSYLDSLFYGKVIPKEHYWGYPNVSKVNDLVTTEDKSDENLGMCGILGMCYNLSKRIVMNIGELTGNLDQYHMTIRHEIRHRIHGISDSNPVGHYIMRALDSTARKASGIYDRVQRYHQKR